MQWISVNRSIHLSRAVLVQVSVRRAAGTCVPALLFVPTNPLKTTCKQCTPRFECVATCTHGKPVVYSALGQASKVTPEALSAELVQAAGSQKEYFLFLVLSVKRTN